MAETIQPVVGMKVKIIRGDMDDSGMFSIPDPTKPRKNHVHWIAGDVPVGSIGEVYDHVIYEWKKPDDPERYMKALKFEGITPKEGYCFGLSFYGLPTDEYEVQP